MVTFLMRKGKLLTICMCLLYGDTLVSYLTVPRVLFAQPQRCVLRLHGLAHHL
jgi:hypothetical protein